MENPIAIFAPTETWQSDNVSTIFIFQSDISKELSWTDSMYCAANDEQK